MDTRYIDVEAMGVTSGILDTENYCASGEKPNFFIQDPDDTLWSGIYVYDTSVSPSIGDEVTLTASVNEYYSLTQLIDVTYSMVNSSGNNIGVL